MVEFSIGRVLSKGGYGRFMTGEDRIHTVADIVHVNTERWPNRVALQEMDEDGAMQKVTFAQLRQRVNRVAARLRRRGVEPGDRAGIIMPNSAHWVAGYMGILTAGGIAVPLEYDFLDMDPGSLAYAIRHSDCNLILARGRDAPAVHDLSDRPILRVDTEPDEGPECEPPAESQDMPEVAQILYTSGTTGHKKGVVLSHKSLLCNVRQCCERFGVSSSDSLPAVLPYHHAYPLTTTVLLPLYLGALMTVGNVRSKRLPELLPRSKPTVLVGVPRFYESLLDKIRHLAEKRGELEKLETAMSVSGWMKKWTGLNAGKLLFGSLHRALFGGRQLQFCISGGARLSERIVRNYLKLGIPLLQGWGMTELGPVGAVQPYSPWKFYFTRHYERTVGSIGTPLRDTQVALVDCPGQDVKVDRDGKGEMLVQGPQLMDGYHEDQRETNLRMGPNGLRTGDIARIDGRGNLYIVGRVKHVIVLPTGKKVFPEEDLYEELASCECVDEFAVKSLVDKEKNERIGIVVRPDKEVLRERGTETVGEMYRTIRDEILNALDSKPAYLKDFDLAVTPVEDGEFQELAKNTVEETCPAWIEFRSAASYHAMKDSQETLDLTPNLARRE